MRSDEDWLRRYGEALPLYLEDGPAPPIDFLHMRVSPWLQFRIAEFCPATPTLSTQTGQTYQFKVGEANCQGPFANRRPERQSGNQYPGMFEMAVTAGQDVSIVPKVGSFATAPSISKVTDCQTANCRPRKLGIAQVRTVADVAGLGRRESSNSGSAEEVR